MSVIRSVLLTTLTLLLCFNAFGQRRSKQKQPDIAALKKQWVDSVYNMLTEDERIGQLFMVPAYSGTKEYNEEFITKLITNHQVGGLIFMQGGPVRQANLTNYYQRIAQVPLLIAMDAEWGLGMRLDSVKKLPRQMMIGATRDTMTAFRVGGVIARQLTRLGVHINFAPDVDVNNNVMNPVINTRSFGEDKTWVAKMGVAYMRGLQSNGVIACAKHFPGHGDTHVDSHNDLPLIPKTTAQLDTLELVPFKQAINAGIKSIMIAHLEVPSLEKQPHVPTTLSKNTITNLLKNKLGFEGLVVTDAMNMQGITKYFKDGDAELMAFKAGNDLILMSPDIPTAIARIKTALAEGTVSQEALETSVRKILAAKYDIGLSKWRDISTRGLWEDLNQYVDPMRQTVTKGAITLVRDDNQIMNKINYTMRIGYVGINANGSTPLYEELNDKFNNVKAHWLPKGTSLDSTQKVLDHVANYDATIIAVHNLNYTPGGNYGLSSEAIAFLQYAGCRNNTMVVLLGNAYAMQYFCGAGSVMVGYEDDTIAEYTVADVLFKKIKPKGKLPVTACIAGKSVCPVATKIPELANEPAYRLRKVLYPADAGVVDQKSLDRIDMFMARNIANGVFPGCRVLAAKDGKIFYDKAFGHMKYDKNKKVDTNTLYDVASCTKVLSTTLAVMRLYEQGKLGLDKTLGDYLPQAKGTNKENLKIKDILLHQAGLKGWIPFYKDVSEDNGDPRADLFKFKQTEGYNIEVAKDLWMRSDYLDTMWEKIYASKLDNSGKMTYSDLDFYFLAAVVKQITGKPIDKYAEDEFYKPMGLKRITYMPLRKFSESQIAPTEIDQGFRNQTLCGYVHDPGAAMLGGVGGHAGLFATAQDVAAIFQMLLNKGSFNGKRYFKAATVNLFTAYGSRISHRALGFDKPLPEEDNGGPAGDRVTASAFGHQGFTGTCVWADPGTGIVFVFLSNRVYPSGSNTKINKLSVRTTAQDYIYEALGYPVNHERPQGYRAQVGNGR
ncbi:MAG: beta-lactamase [Flavipsychrobacter sp.]|jgi:beta-glucosidase-like glycosyl hydrolase/CubicO group peptidase (beta-lactamase class C family)|nr:beta-lactamase [Flavipsychrobacter sp.]